VKSDLLNVGALVAAVLLLAAGGPWLARELSSLPHPAKLAARGNERIVTLDVGGMTCRTCAGAVKGRLDAVPGVHAVDVRLGERRAYVVCDRVVADTALTAAVHLAGGGFSAEVASR
jgi:copper chaperone CopZ